MRIVYTANTDWAIYRYRISLAKHHIQRGHSVVAVCPSGRHVEKICSVDGLKWVEWELDRKGLNPVRAAREIFELSNIYRRLEPDLIHQDMIKPMVYGTLATRWLAMRHSEWSVGGIVNSFMGTGFLFSDRFVPAVLRTAVVPLMRRLFRREKIAVTFSNEADRAVCLEAGVTTRERSQVIVSEFVDTDRFAPPDSGKRTDVPSDDRVIVLLAARLLWAKGVGVFVEAASELQRRGVDVEMWLAGAPDTGSRGYVPEEDLRAWHDEGMINWLGYCDDMPALLRRVDIAALPTYYNEGLPRFLVEAAATGLPLIASDMAACRRAVRDHVNGLLVSQRDPVALADAVETLVTNPQMRREFGERSRSLAVGEFEEEAVIQEWETLYRSLIW